MANEEKSKPKMGFTIIKNDPTDGHKGFGIGSLSLENVSPVIIDVAEGTAIVDVGAMHAKSAVEKGIKFTVNREDSIIVIHHSLNRIALYNLSSQA